MKNKKLLIIISGCVVLIGLLFFLFIDKILTLFGIGAIEPVVVEQQQETVLPADKMEPAELLEKSLKKLMDTSLKPLGYENLEIKALKGKFYFNIKLPENITAKIPKNLEKFKDLDFSCDFKIDLANKRMALNFITPFTKPIFTAFSQNALTLFLAESQKKYTIAQKEISQMQTQLPVKFDLKEMFDFSQMSGKGLKEKFDFSKTDENNKIFATILLKSKNPKKIYDFEMFEEYKYKIDKRNFLIMQIENTISYSNKQIPPQTTIVEMHYNQDNSLILKCDVSNSMMKDKKIEFIYAYKNNLYSEMKIRAAEQDLGAVKYTIANEKITGLVYENSKLGLPIKVGITDLLLTAAGLEDYEFSPENSDEFENKALTELFSQINDKKIIAELFLQKDADKFFETIAPHFMELAETLKFNQELTANNNEAAVAVQQKSSKDDAEEDEDAESEETPQQQKSSKQQSAKEAQASKEQLEKIELAKKIDKKVELETKNDEDDEEETDDADNKKIAKSSKSSAASAIAITQKSDKINVENMRSSKKSAAVDKQPKKEIVQKKETAQIQYQPKERSAQFLAVIRKYNNNKQADIEAAYNEVKELVKSETDNVEALYMLGHLAYQKKKYDEAQQYFDI
ncbi:MAG TPA: hypothetical protein PLJ38_03160, partial [bacterium]|nr:hypothetical protein [bacterium]